MMTPYTKILHRGESLDAKIAVFICLRSIQSSLKNVEPTASGNS